LRSILRQSNKWQRTKEAQVHHRRFFVIEDKKQNKHRKIYRRTTSTGKLWLFNI